MSRHAGVVRDREGLERLAGLLEQAPPGDGEPDLATVEATSLHAVSVLVAASALARAESRGCHRWRDVPSTSGQPACHTVLRVESGRVRLAEAVGALIGAVA
jgi:L-aspartate oxidase